MSRYYSALLCGLVLLTSFGCGGEKAPEGFPRLWPTKVKVLNGAEPIAHVNVILVPEASSMNYVISAKTDASGVAAISTTRGTYTRPGAPDGAYRVMLVEAVKVEMPELTMHETATMTAAQNKARQKEYNEKLAAVRSFSEIFADPLKTPCRLEVASQATTIEFDVSRKN